MRELLKYPIHILKRELDVRDLKEKIVIFSKSIKAHFTAPLISSLQSVQSSDDYSRLDMTVVFTLLQNFCENIKPPRKGWDYEPPSDEVTTGADIERIRLMWNKYCDDDLQCPQLDDVFNRMKDKFGTVAVHGDDGERKSPDKEEGFEDIKDKVSCKKYIIKFQYFSLYKGKHTVFANLSSSPNLFSSVPCCASTFEYFQVLQILKLQS